MAKRRNTLDYSIEEIRAIFRPKAKAPKLKPIAVITPKDDMEESFEIARNMGMQEPVGCSHIFGLKRWCKNCGKWVPYSFWDLA